MESIGKALQFLTKVCIVWQSFCFHYESFKRKRVLEKLALRRCICTFSSKPKYKILRLEKCTSPFIKHKALSLQLISKSKAQVKKKKTESKQSFQLCNKTFCVCAFICYTVVRSALFTTKVFYLLGQRYVV